MKASRTISGALVLGRGLLAREIRSAPKNYKHSVIFASGVSSSIESDSLAYLRENILLTRALRLRRPLVYFGSISSGPVNRRRYYQHKYKTELRVVRASSKNRVLNLPQIFGLGGHPSNLVNLFLNELLKGERPPIIEDALRFVLPSSQIPAIIVSDLGSRVSIIHNNPISPAHLLAILEAELSGFSRPVLGRTGLGRKFALNKSERLKGRRIISLKQVTSDYLEEELRLYVRRKRG